MLTNCTISGNRASASGGGVSNSGTVTLRACTISGNVASVSGGGIFNHDFIDHRGVAALTDTIVALNTANDGTPSEIAGPEAGSVTGTFNLIGPGGSGGIQGGTQGNIVLASLAGVGLAPLGNYGGSTQTIALLPGSPALGAGTAVIGITTDQRGLPLDVPIDIGAFQSQGFVLSLASNTSPQSAPTGEAFANPLVVTVVARNPAEPVTGGIVSFAITPDAGGAGAGLSAATAIIGADHHAQVTATANAIEGNYSVTALTAGGLTLPRIFLTNVGNNLVHLGFAELAPSSITFGTATVTFTGVVAFGGVGPQGQLLSVSFGGLTQQVVIGRGGAFAATFNTAGLTVAGSPYSVTYQYTSDGTFASVGTTSILMVTSATPTLGVVATGGTFNNSAFPATATVAGTDGVAAGSLEGIAPALTYYSGAHTTAELAGLTPLGGAPSQAGSYTVVARFPGSPDYAATQSTPVTFTIGRAGATVALAASVGSAVFGQPITLIATVAAAGNPTGTVTFFDGTTSLGTAALDGSGRATLTATNLPPGSHTITASYSGDADRLGGTSGSAMESVARAGSQLILVRHPVFKRKKLVSVGLTAVVAPVSPGGGIPTGTVTFLVNKKTLGTLALGGGQATLTLKATSVLNKAITVNYTGDAEFQPGQGATPVLTRPSLKSLARPMVHLSLRTPSPSAQGGRGR
jgi:hypothetical protein